MKCLDKSSIYSTLFEIKETHNEDISKYIKEVSRSDTSIPSNTLKFINKYHPLQQLETYNQIYNRRYKNPLYKNLVNEDLPVEEKAIAISSLITQSLIRMKSLDENDRKEFAYIMNFNTLVESLNNYASTGDDVMLNDTFMNVRNVLKNLFSKED